MTNRYLPPKLAALLAVAWTVSAGCGDSDSNNDSPPVVPQDDAAAGSAGAAGSTADASAAIVDLRADTNRNGVVEVDDPSEDLDEETWDKSHGAVFLANIDDDRVTCPKTGTDAQLAQCNDAADEEVNGDDDLADMARLKTVPWADAPDDATGALSLGSPGSQYVRLFRKKSDGSFGVFKPDSDKLTAAELRDGVELAVEGTDIVRDAAQWDGYVDITFRVQAPAGESTAEVDSKDTVRMRVSPVMLFHHLLPVETSYTTTAGGWAEYQLFVDDFQKAVDSAQVPNGLTLMKTDDPWTQDFFEAGYMSMPAANGAQKVIRVFYRSANVENPGSMTNPLRSSGKTVFTALRGKDIAGVQQFDTKHPEEMDSLDSMGNTETIPPYSLNGVDYPLGRMARGSVSNFYTDPKFSLMLESQQQQPPVYVDTSWLLVGHIDETLSYVKASSPRGWVVLANDARLAKKMLEDQVAKGNGGVKMFEGMSWFDDNYKPYPAEKTIQEVLDDAEVMNESAAAAVEVDAQLELLKKETGLTDAEIVPVPFLHWPAYGYSLAYQPGTVNGVYLSDTHWAAPDPHGPIIEGKDIFKVQLEEVLEPYGITVDWVEDWEGYHALEGEVHCGSNSARKIPEVKWWETGR